MSPAEGEWIVEIDGEQFFPTACLRYAPGPGLLQQLVWNYHPVTGERLTRWVNIIERPEVGYWRSGWITPP